jgi:tetratricopeptide (TPR) repeat protein
LVCFLLRTIPAETEMHKQPRKMISLFASSYRFLRLAVCGPRLNITRHTMFFFILLSAFHPVVRGQHKIPGNPKSRAIHDSTIADRMNDLSAEFISGNRQDSADHFASRALEESDILNYFHGIAIAYLRKSRIAAYFNSDFTLSEKMGKEALYYYERTPDKTGIDTLYSYLFDAAFAEGKFDEAIDYSEKFYAAALQKNDQDGIFNSLYWMFAINRQVGNYEKSFSYVQQLNEIAAKSGNKIWIATAWWGVAELYKLIEDYPNALNYFQRVVKLNDPELMPNRINSDRGLWFEMEFAEVFSLMNKFDSAWHYYGLLKPVNENIKSVYLVSTGECHLLQGNYPLALQNFKTGLAGLAKQNDVNEVMRTLLDIAKVYLILGNSSAAAGYGRQGLNIALQIRGNQYIRDGYKILSDAYDRLHLPDSSNYYFRKYIIVKDAVLNDQARGIFAAFQYEERIALMNKEKQIQEMRLQKETLMKNLLFAGIAVLLILSFIFFRNILLKRRYEARQRQIAENELRIQKLESEKSTAELLHQRSELEMKALRAQMNPHFIFNCLNSINRFIIGNNAEEAADYLTKFAKLIRMVLENSGKPFLPLKEELDCLRLYMDLERLRFEEPFVYEIHCQDIDPESVMIPSLLIQPFVENAIWHGLHPREDLIGKIIIVLHLEQDILLCEIRDNGIGTGRSAVMRNRNNDARKSFGIEFTRRRLKLADPLLNNSMGVSIRDVTDDSGENTGTSVQIRIPIRQA